MTFVLAAVADRLDATRPEVILGLLVLVLAQVLLVLAIRGRTRRGRDNRAPLARPRPARSEGDPPPRHEPASPAQVASSVAATSDDTPPVPAHESPGIAHPSGDPAGAGIVPDLGRPRPPREYMYEPAAASGEVAPREPEPREPEPDEPVQTPPAAEPVAPSVVTARPATAPRGPRVGTALITGAALTALVAALLLYLTRTRESRV